MHAFGVGGDDVEGVPSDLFGRQISFVELSHRANLRFWPSFPQLWVGGHEPVTQPLYNGCFARRGPEFRQLGGLIDVRLQAAGRHGRQPAAEDRPSGYFYELHCVATQLLQAAQRSGASNRSRTLAHVRVENERAASGTRSWQQTGDADEVDRCGGYEAARVRAGVIGFSQVRRTKSKAPRLPSRTSRAGLDAAPPL